VGLRDAQRYNRLDAPPGTPPFQKHESRSRGLSFHPEPPEGLRLGGVDHVEMGRYMATTMPPITTPITTIMIGSSTEVSALTAAST
jgi:hypothetical protein